VQVAQPSLKTDPLESARSILTAARAGWNWSSARAEQRAFQPAPPRAAVSRLARTAAS
jgi:hypothetical protein